MRVAAVVLAAGASRRLGRPKQLVRVAGEPLVRRAVRAALGAGCAPVVVVTGASAREVETALAGIAATFVHNDAFEEGLASSLRAGVARAIASTPPCDGVLVALVDQPDVDEALLRELLARFAGSHGTRTVACAYAGGFGVPALFPRALAPELLARRGDRGAKALLEERAEEVIAVRFPAGGTDVDVEADLLRLADPRARRSRRPRAG